MKKEIIFKYRQFSIHGTVLKSIENHNFFLLIQKSVFLNSFRSEFKSLYSVLRFDCYLSVKNSFSIPHLTFTYIHFI